MFAARDARRAGGAWRLAGRAAWAALLWPALAPLAGPAVAGGEPAVIARPVEVFWGGYRRNEQLVDEGAAGWEQVRQHLDGVILHGAYWNQASNSIGSPSPDIVGPKLAALLAGAGGRKVLLEHLLGGVYPDVEAAFGAAAAGDPAAPAGFSSGVPNIRRLMSYGFPLPEVSTDFIMDAWRQSVRMHPHWTSSEFFTALAGSWETYHGAEFDPAPGSADRAKFGWFRQWVEGLAAAFPHIRVSCTNSPVYFNWDEGGTNRRELGGNYNNFFTWLKLERRGDHITALYSGDGAGWRALGGATVPLGGAPVAGLFAASLDAGRLAQARFDNLRVLPCYFADIGKTGLGGSLATDGASYTLKGRGNEALHPGNNTSDALFLAWREWTGDGVFTARLDSLTNSNPGRTNPAGEIASAGITLRESSARDARQVSLLANFANQLEFLARGTTGGGLAPVAGSGSPAAGLGVANAPRWLRLARAGDTITASHSADGSAWTVLGTVALPLPATVQVGMSADSQVRFEEATAVFSQVDFLTPLAVSFSGTNVGAAGSGATSSLAGSTVTLKARGVGLAGTADAGRLYATPLAGDGTLVARLAWFADDVANAHPLPPGAQMGLTLRAGTEAGAAQFGVVFTPQLGLRALHRAAPGGDTAEVAGYGAGEVSVQRLGAQYRPLLHYFTGNDFMRSLHEAFPGEFAANFAGFTTDSPYAGYQKWGGAETHPDALLHRQKIILYERWLQQRGRGHDFIANSAGGTDFAGIDTTTEAGRDQWDRVYKNGSLRAIQLHQLEGGRPDRVLFESWYDGPFTMVPESRAGSFANLALDGLKYLKGPGQNLDLLWRRDDEGAWAGEAVYQQQPQGVQARVWTAADHGDRVVFQVRLVNRGEVAALPVIHAHESGADGWALAYQLAGADITAAVRAAEGLPLTAGPLYSGNELIAPGAAVDLELVIDAPAPAGPREVLLRAFWNPQDPSNAPRDALALTLLPPPDPPADAALGHWPFDSGLADVSGWRRHLTAAGGSTTGAPPVKVGAAALQAGAAGARAATAAAVPLGDAFTVAAWVYLPAGPGSVRTIAANSVSGFNANGFRFFANTFNTSDGKLILETGNGSQAAALASPAGTLATGRWQHVAATVNRAAGTATLYRNGLPVATGAVRADFANNAPLVWAAMSGGTNSLRGSLDDARVLPRAAPAGEVAALAAAANTPPTLTGPADLTLAAGATSAALGIGIDDAETPPADLLIEAISSDPLLLPPSAIALGGADGARTITLSPVAWRGGAATVTLVVGDGLATRQTSFVLTVSNPGFPARWTATAAGAGLPWSAGGHWENATPPWPGAACELEFLTGIAAPAGEIAALQDLAAPFALRRLVLGGSGPAVGSARISQQGGELALVANGTGTPALALVAQGALAHRLENPVSLAANLQVSGDGDASFELAGPLTGAAGLVKTGKATLALSGANSYGGHTNIQAGAIRAAHASALGATSGGTTVQGGTARAALELAAGSVIPEPIQLVMHNHADHTQLRNHSGHNTLTGQLSLNAGGGRWDIAATGGSLTLAGPLVNVSTGTDTWRTLHLHGPAGGTITGNLTNSASGNSLTNVRVQSGAWELSGGAKSYTGATTVAGGSLTVHAALVSPVTVLGGATVGGNGSTTGDLTLHDQARLRVRVDDWDAPPVGFTAARLLTGSASLLTVTIDATGILGFTETPRSIPLVTTTAETPTPPAAAVAFETGAFPGSGTWSLAVAGSQLILAYQPDPYAAWTAGIDWQGEDSGPLADPERDGLPNLLEFALGGDPLVPDTGIAPRPWLAADGRLAITFWRRADPALHYQVEAAASPAGPWLTVWASTGPANTAGPVTVADVPPPGTPPARFLRLRVTR